jgi:hypothetical protein
MFMPKVPSGPGGPTPPVIKIDDDSKFYLSVIGSAAATGAVLGGPPGVLVGGLIGTAISAVHYFGERPKRPNGSDQES